MLKKFPKKQTHVVRTNPAEEKNLEGETKTSWNDDAHANNADAEALDRVRDA